ncbi:MAG TPA: R3H domain-containing nucleic acid-binding protein [Candidatus Paceibacterota bacterium]|nr:R3H domain-containing nucleic acid-binding protein [Candidatus Paceibacterota bacterium]
MSEAIKKIIEDVLRSGNFQYEEISLQAPELEDLSWYQIRTSTPDALIGKGGETLSALNHLVKKIADKTIGKNSASGVAVGDNTSVVSLDFFIDVNDFQKKKVDNIKTVAHMMAERARFFKSSVQVDPMSPFERKIMHAFLAKHPDIKTASEGVGPNRHIVISFTENKE